MFPFFSIENECMRIDSFADGNDNSIEAIGKRRNLFYHKQLAERIEKKMNEVMSWMTHGLNIHLNINQSFEINSSAVFMSLEKLNLRSLSNQTIENIRIHFPTNLTATLPSKQSQSLRVGSPFFVQIERVYFFYSSPSNPWHRLAMATCP
jgi:hypothetical protein